MRRFLALLVAVSGCVPPAVDVDRLASNVAVAGEMEHVEQRDGVYVTEDSANLGSIEPGLAAYRRFVPYSSRDAHHATVASGTVAEVVLELIRSIQPMKDYR